MLVHLLQLFLASSVLARNCIELRRSGNCRRSSASPMDGVKGMLRQLPAATAPQLPLWMASRGRSGNRPPPLLSFPARWRQGDTGAAGAAAGGTPRSCHRVERCRRPQGRCCHRGRRCYHSSASAAVLPCRANFSPILCLFSSYGANFLMFCSTIFSLLMQIHRSFVAILFF